jgi:hypothetical protein
MHGLCSILILGKVDSRWLLAIVEELLQEMGTSLFGDVSELAPLLSSPNAALTSMGISWLWRSTKEVDGGVISLCWKG